MSKKRKKKKVVIIPHLPITRIHLLNEEVAFEIIQMVRKRIQLYHEDFHDILMGRSTLYFLAEPYMDWPNFFINLSSFCAKGYLTYQYLLLQRVLYELCHDMGIATNSDPEPLAIGLDENCGTHRMSFLLNFLLWVANTMLSNIRSGAYLPLSPHVADIFEGDKVKQPEMLESMV